MIWYKNEVTSLKLKWNSRLIWDKWWEYKKQLQKDILVHFQVYCCKFYAMRWCIQFIPVYCEQTKFKAKKIFYSTSRVIGWTEMWIVYDEAEKRWEATEKLKLQNIFEAHLWLKIRILFFDWNLTNVCECISTNGILRQIVQYLCQRQSFIEKIFG